MTDDPVDLGNGLRDLASLLVADETVSTTLGQVVAVACRCVSRGSGASATLLRGGAPYTAQASDDRIRTIDERQFELNEGPCIEAIKTGDVQLVEEIAGDERWADLAPLVAAVGITSVMAIPLKVRGETVGVLTIYTDDGAGFDDAAQQSALLLADQAAVTVANAMTHDECIDRVQQLQGALDSRVVIEQAKGVLMERRGCSADAAFAELRDMSQHANRRIHAVAEDVVASVTTDHR